MPAASVAIVVKQQTCCSTRQTTQPCPASCLAQTVKATCVSLSRLHLKPSKPVSIHFVANSNEGRIRVHPCASRTRGHFFVCHGHRRRCGGLSCRSRQRDSHHD